MKDDWRKKARNQELKSKSVTAQKKFSLHQLISLEFLYQFKQNIWKEIRLMLWGRVLREYKFALIPWNLSIRSIFYRPKILQFNQGRVGVTKRHFIFRFNLVCFYLIVRLKTKLMRKRGAYWHGSSALTVRAQALVKLIHRRLPTLSKSHNYTEKQPKFKRN